MVWDSDRKRRNYRHRQKPLSSNLQNLVGMVIDPHVTAVIYGIHSTVEIDEETVMQLAGMGFSLEGCRRAVFKTGNSGRWRKRQ